MCPHCRQPLVRWRNPQVSTWGADFQYVCFNDACAYFVRGWSWMQEHYNVAASYRFRLDPATGETGPLPVWSPEALKGGIVPEDALTGDRRDVPASAGSAPSAPENVPSVPGFADLEASEHAG